MTTTTQPYMTSPIINGTPTGSGMPKLIFLKGDNSGNYVTANTSYERVGDELSATTVVPMGWKLSIAAHGSMFVTTAIVEVNAAIYDSGTLLTRAIVVPSVLNTAGAAGEFALFYVITGDGAAHNPHLRFKTTNASDSAGMLNTSSAMPTMILRLEPAN